MSRIKIPLKQIHICDESCAMIFEEVPETSQNIISGDSETDNMIEQIANIGWFLMRSVPNPSYIDGKCDKFGQKKSAYINIKSYSPDECHIVGMDEVVIYDNEIFIEFSYPLEQTRLYRFTSATGNGFTRRDIIDIICNTYHAIYQIEDETTPENQYYFTKVCTNCNEEKIEPNEFELVNEKTDDICPICHDDYQQIQIVSKLPCGHFYHKSCIDEWFKMNLVCPMCKEKCSTTIRCGNCVEGTLEIKYTGKVLPMELRMERGGLINRETTNGVFGIWGHDLTDLVIESLNYDSKKKRLEMFIGS